MSELPADWQRALVHMIRGAAPADGALFAGSDSLSGDDQLAIYREQFQLRVPEALRQDAPGLHHLLGAQADTTFARYLLECPPDSWSLDHLGRRLEAWLLAQQAPIEQVEMARVDEAVQRIFFAREPVPLRPDDLAGMPRLKRSSGLEMLRLTRAVHRYRAQALGGEPPDPIEPGDFFLLLHRKQRRVRHLEVHPACYHLLQHIEAGIQPAVEDTLASGLIDADTLGAQISAWFRVFAERGLVELDTGGARAG